MRLGHMTLTRTRPPHRLNHNCALWAVRWRSKVTLFVAVCLLSSTLLSFVLSFSFFPPFLSFFFLEKEKIPKILMTSSPSYWWQINTAGGRHTLTHWHTCELHHRCDCWTVTFTLLFFPWRLKVMNSTSLSSSLQLIYFHICSLSVCI